MCDASNFGAVLLQSHIGTNKTNLISAKPRLFTQAVLRFSTLMRVCTAIIRTMNFLQSHIGTNKMNLISAKPRLFTQAVLQLSSLMRECTAIIPTMNFPRS